MSDFIDSLYLYDGPGSGARDGHVRGHACVRSVPAGTPVEPITTEIAGRRLLGEFQFARVELSLQ